MQLPIGPQSAEQIAITTKIQSFWIESSMGPILYPNEDVSAAPGKARTTVEIEHPQGGRTKESIGSTSRIHSLGFVTFACHLGLGSGALQAKGIADIIAAEMDELYLYTTVDDLIVFRVSSMQTLGQKENTYRVAIIVPFRRQQIG